MLELRPTCENCNKLLPNDSDEAMICTFECTFCLECVTNVLENVCPNCGGGFEKRPTRPSKSIEKRPATTNVTYHPVNMDSFIPLKEQFKHIHPRKR